MRLPLAFSLAAATSLLALSTTLAACGDTTMPSGPGVGCKTSDTCASGLNCVDPADTFVSENDAGCTGATSHGITICTKTCTIDADCSTFGVDVVCAPNGCGPTGICLRRSDAGARPGSP